MHVKRFFRPAKPDTNSDRNSTYSSSEFSWLRFDGLRYASWPSFLACVLGDYFDQTNDFNHRTLDDKSSNARRQIAIARTLVRDPFCQ